MHAIHSFRDIGCAKARLAILPRRRQPLMLNMVIVVCFLLLFLRLELVSGRPCSHSFIYSPLPAYLIFIPGNWTHVIILKLSFEFLPFLQNNFFRPFSEDMCSTLFLVHIVWYTITLCTPNPNAPYLKEELYL